MNKSVEILKLPVISIFEVTDLGFVKGFIINPAKKTVMALLIEDAKWYMGAKALLYTDITAIGENVVTIEHAEVVKFVPESAELQQFLASEVNIIGTKVLTKKGKFKGKVTEIQIAEDGRIVACEVEDEKGDMQVVPVEKILTFAKEVTIIEEGNDLPKVATSAPKTESLQSEPVKKFDENHRKYLLGKKSTHRITTDKGMLIVDQGGEITEEVVQKARLAGKFAELSTSIE